MAETYKILGQKLTGELALDNSTAKEVIVYEVPANTQASISAIEITNSSAFNQTYKLSFVKDAEVSQANANLQYSLNTTIDVAVAVSNGGNPSLRSTDGSSWQNVVIDNSNNLYDWRAVGYGDGMFVAFATGNIMPGATAYSADGITWTIGSGLNFSGTSVAYGNGVFVVVGSDTVGSAHSFDGINWFNNIDLNPNSSFRFNKVAYGDGVFVAIPINYNENRILYSYDGITWNQSFIFSSGNWDSITYGNDKFVAFSNEGMGAYSYDGINWYQYWSPAPPWSSMRALTYIDGVFFVIPAWSSTGYYSSDGIIWTSVSVPGNAAWVAATSTNNKAFITGYGNQIISSSDGINWSVSQVRFTFYTGVAAGPIEVQQTLTQSIPQSLNKHVAIHNKTIVSGETHEIKGGITLSAGDQIRAYSTSDDIIVNVYGVEIS